MKGLHTAILEATRLRASRAWEGATLHETARHTRQGRYLHAQTDAEEGSVLLDVGGKGLRESLGVQRLHSAAEGPHAGKDDHLLVWIFRRHDDGDDDDVMMTS